MISSRANKLAEVSYILSDDDIEIDGLEIVHKK